MYLGLEDSILFFCSQRFCIFLFQFGAPLNSIWPGESANNTFTNSVVWSAFTILRSICDRPICFGTKWDIRLALAECIALQQVFFFTPNNIESMAKDKPDSQTLQMLLLMALIYIH